MSGAVRLRILALSVAFALALAVLHPSIAGTAARRS